MHDFACYIRLNDANKTLDGVFAMMKIMLLTNCASYKLPLMLNILVLMYLRESKHPVWHLFQTECSLFNEEICERSLSSLAQVIQSDTMRYKLQHMNDMYRLTKNRSLLLKFFREVTSTSRSTWEGLKLDDDDVQAAIVHLKLTIRKIATNQYQHYTGDPGEWTNIVTATRTLANVSTPLWYKKSTLVELKKVLGRVRSSIVGCNFSNTFEVYGSDSKDVEVDMKIPGDDLESAEMPDMPVELESPADFIHDDANVADEGELDSDSENDMLDAKHSERSPVTLPSSALDSKLSSLQPAPTRAISFRGTIKGPRAVRKPTLERPMSVAQVRSVIRELTADLEGPSSQPSSGRPQRAAAPVRGQFMSSLQTPEIVEGDVVIPPSPPVKRKRGKQKGK